MLITVIICTYRRAADLERLLLCFEQQSYRDFELLIVDGSGNDPSVRACVQLWSERSAVPIDFKLLNSEAGLTRQRNVGLRHSKGEVVVFLDDDVTVHPVFLEQVATILADSKLADVGGFTAYDTINYPLPPNLRWRLRKRLGVVATLEPGFADRLGRNVPLSFAQPFNGFRTVSWLPGFCMIYRRNAIENLAFDEQLPTYGGEDRDFSMRVGDRWRLLMCGDLQVQHHCSAVNRVTGTRQVFQTAYGIGRGFRKRAQGWSDAITIVTYAMREFVVEGLAGLKHPAISSLLAPIARMRGLLAGWNSLQSFPATEFNKDNNCALAECKFVRQKSSPAR